MVTSDDGGGEGGGAGVFADWELSGACTLLLALLQAATGAAALTAAPSPHHPLSSPPPRSITVLGLHGLIFLAGESAGLDPPGTSGDSPTCFPLLLPCFPCPLLTQRCPSHRIHLRPQPAGGILSSSFTLLPAPPPLATGCSRCWPAGCSSPRSPAARRPSSPAIGGGEALLSCLQPAAPRWMRRTARQATHSRWLLHPPPTPRTLHPMVPLLPPPPPVLPPPPPMACCP